MSRKRNILILAGIGGGLIIFVSVQGAMHIDLAPVYTLVLYAGLVAVTMVYAYFVMETAQATRQQAEASVKMAEEMREQRIIASRPVIIQEAIPRKYISEKDMSDYFQIYNAGSSPAIELEISILNQEKTPIVNERKTFLRAGEPPIQFTPFDSVKLEDSTYYLVCEYKSIFSRAPHLTWYQTWLPFQLKSNKEGKVYVTAGELEFRDEVTEKDRIDAFSSRSKPQ